MRRVEISENFSLSQIAYGMWRLSEDADTRTEHVIAKIRSCLDQGITTLDQADIYGGYTAESLLGKAFAQDPSLRQSVELISKCDIVAPVGRYASARLKYYDTGYKHIHAAVEQSLIDLHVEVIDLLLVHRPDPMMDHVETGKALDALVDGGKVRHVGVSNFKPHDFTLLQSAMTHPLRTNQIELSIQAHQGFTNGDVAFHQQRGDPIMAWSPLAGGALLEPGNPVHATLNAMAERFGEPADAIAVAWLLAHPARILPVLGTNNLERIARLGRAIDIQLERQDWFELYTAALGHEVA